MICTCEIKKEERPKRGTETMKSPDSKMQDEIKVGYGNCSLCHFELILNIDSMFDTRFGIKMTYRIAGCPSCGLIQTTPIPAADELESLYGKYYNFGGEKGTFYTRVREWLLSSSAYRLWISLDGDISFHSYKGSGRLLDIGCNEGRGLKIYQRNGYEAEGLELNEVAGEEARAKGFTVYVQAMEDFQPGQPYDVIVLSNVLEHSLNPEDMLFHVHRLLKPGGHVWISLPNNESWLRKIFGPSWINWHLPFHLFHFSRKTLRQLLHGSGFEITQVRNVTPSHWVAQSVVAAIFARRGRQTRQLRLPLLVASLMIFCRFFLFLFLWLGNLTGRGDCLIVEAIARGEVSD